MIRERYLLSSFLLSLTVGSVTPVVADLVFFVEQASEWSYLPGTAEASSPDRTASCCRTRNAVPSISPAASPNQAAIISRAANFSRWE